MKNKLSKLFSYLPIMYSVMLSMLSQLKIKVLMAWEDKSIQLWCLISLFSVNLVIIAELSNRLLSRFL
jgi:hypothetical protein